MNRTDDNEIKTEIDAIVSRIDKIIKAVNQHYPETTATQTGEKSGTQTEEP